MLSGSPHDARPASGVSAKRGAHGIRPPVVYQVVDRLRVFHANNKAQMLPRITTGRRSSNNCDGPWPADFNSPPNLGPTMDPIRPNATAAPTPTPRMLVGYETGAIA